MTGAPASSAPQGTAPASPWLLTSQRGVTYLMLMFSILIIGASLTVVGKQWKMVVQRDKEAELVFRANRIKTAIEAFAADHAVKKATRPNRYPRTLEELTKKPKRYLQVVYKDPMTGEDFGLIKIGGQVMGVKSRSKEKPISTVLFKNAVSYDQVTFQVTAPQGQPCMPGVSAINPLNPMATAPCPQSGSTPVK